MKPDEAVEFCESMINCAYCPIKIYGLDRRSRYQKEIEHMMCCENLIEHPDWHAGEDGWDEYEWR